MKLISWNVNGIRAIKKKDFDQQIQNINPDILCLQETKAQDEQVISALNNFSGYHLYVNSATKKGYSGVAILSKEVPLSIAQGIGVDIHDHEGRVLTAEYPHFYLVNVYVPNSGRGLSRLDYRTLWDQDFSAFLFALEQKKPVILTGDLNVAHQAIDLANPKTNYNKTAGYTQKEIDGFQRLLDHGMIDTFRELYPEEIAYTYWNYMFNARARNVGWRIDYFVVSQDLRSGVIDSYMLSKEMGSDHCPIGLQFNIEKT